MRQRLAGQRAHDHANGLLTICTLNSLQIPQLVVADLEEHLDQLVDGALEVGDVAFIFDIHEPVVVQPLLE